MTILFDATRPVKSKNPRRFAAGLLAFVPMTYVSHTASDETAYCEMLADMEQARRDFDQHIEERYQMSMALDRVCSGNPLF
jgi:hypothetical protein